MLLRDAALSRPPPLRRNNASLLRRRRRVPATTAAASAPASAADQTSKRIAVVGAGVAGLTSALRLQRAHPSWRVVVLADLFTDETTTSGAAGIWGPYKLSETSEKKVLRWSRETYRHLCEIAHSAEAADAGIGRLRATTLLTEKALAALRKGEGNEGAEDENEAPLPYWAEAVGGARAFSRVPDEELALYSSTLNAPDRGLPPLPAQLCRFGGGSGGGAPAASTESDDEAAAGAAPLGPDPHAADLVAGYTWPTAVCEGRLYLRWLARALERAGGRVVRHRVASVALLASGEERVDFEQQEVGDEDEERRGAPMASAAATSSEAAAGAAAAAARTENNDDDDESAAGFDCVVDAAGLRAPELFPDDARQVYPIRGHVLRVRAPWVKEAVFAETGHNGGTGVYVLPNRDCVVIGGTGGVGDGDRAPRAQERAAILRAALALVPSLARAEPVGEWVGLRPGRTSARVGEVEWIEVAAAAGTGAAAGTAAAAEKTAAEKTAGAEATASGTAAAVAGRRAVPVVHNYGHGGSGLTLAWGCAADVLAAVDGALGVPRSGGP